MKKENIFCPACNHLHIFPASGKDKLKPEQISVCFMCGTILKFSPEMHLKEICSHQFNRLEQKERIALLELQFKIITFDQT